MSSSEKKYHAGWVKDAHGLKGELYIQLFAKKADWLDSFEEFWLITKDKKELHFEVSHAQPHRDGLIVGTTSMTNRNESEAVKTAEFHIPAEYLQAKPGEAIFLHEILEFMVKDGDKEIGRVKSFSTNGPQDLLNVDTADGEMLIPFVSAFIKQIDFDNRVIIMELPEGLGANDL